MHTVRAGKNSASRITRVLLPAFSLKKDSFQDGTKVLLI